MSNERICPECGAKLKENENFCHECGADFPVESAGKKEESAPAAESVPPTAAMPSMGKVQGKVQDSMPEVPDPGNKTSVVGDKANIMGGVSDNSVRQTTVNTNRQTSINTSSVDNSSTVNNNTTIVMGKDNVEYCEVCGNPFGEKQGLWLGFAPFSAQPGKTYPEDMSRKAVELLAARCERLFIHSGGGVEKAFAEEMERLYPNVTALFGKVRFDGEIDLIANLDCVVSMDSLVMHLAALVATPVVSVWGATHPSLGFLGYGVSPEGILQPEMACRPCSVFGNRPCRFGDYRCMREISPEEIVAKVQQLVGR